MKFKSFFGAFVAALMLGFGIYTPALAQTYPTANPSYLPNAVLSVNVTAASDTVFNSNGLNTFTIRTTGTHTGLAAVVQVANDPVNAASPTWQTINLVPIAGGVPVNSIGNTNGAWIANVAGYTQVRVHVTVLSTGSANLIMAGNTGLLGPMSTGGDPCLNSTYLKSSVAVNQGASATTKVVDTSGTTTVYVCGFSASFVGTNPTATFKTGTHVSADCDTSTASLSGAINPSATVGNYTLNGDGTKMSSIAGGQICLTTAATTSVQGVLTYVQQ